jgi:hypothetical protein
MTTGRCLCGGVRFRLNGAMRDAVLCHCGQCRSWHGHASAYTRVAISDLVFDDDDSLAWYRSSDIARRGFCRICGSSLFWERIDSGTMSVTAGSLDAPTGLKTSLQIFCEDAGDYYPLDAAIPTRPRSSGA